MSKSRLQRELKKNRPFDSLAEETILNILRTSDQFKNRFGRLFREFDLTPTQYNILRVLRGEGKPMPCLEIGDRMIQVGPAMTGLLDRLEKQGLIQRERCTQDRRVNYVALTESALHLLKRMDGPVNALHKQVIGHLTSAELKQLSRLMEKARLSIQNVPD